MPYGLVKTLKSWSELPEWLLTVKIEPQKMKHLPLKVDLESVH